MRVLCIYQCCWRLLLFSPAFWKKRRKFSFLRKFFRWCDGEWMALAFIQQNRSPSSYVGEDTHYTPTHTRIFLLGCLAMPCHWFYGRLLERKVIYCLLLFHVLLVAILRFDCRKWNFLLECFEGKTKESLKTKSLSRRRETILLVCLEEEEFWKILKKRRSWLIGIIDSDVQTLLFIYGGGRLICRCALCFMCIFISYINREKDILRGERVFVCVYWLQGLFTLKKSEFQLKRECVRWHYESSGLTFPRG